MPCFRLSVVLLQRSLHIVSFSDGVYRERLLTEGKGGSKLVSAQKSKNTCPKASI